MDQISVVLTDDHVVVRNGIKLLLENSHEINVIGEGANGQEALDLCKELKPDVLVIDIRMPIMNGIEATSKINEYSTTTKVLILSMHDDAEYILDAAEKGASGYLLKDSSSDEFLKAIKTVNEGKKYFSGDISKVLVEGYLNMKHTGTTPVVAQQGNHEEKIDLTKREKEILQFVAHGKSSKDIASVLNKSVRTVETHRFNIMKKMGVKSAVELISKINEMPTLKVELGL
ncbi:response regulator transcription factor [Flammeovirga kamogawensis]|uniref:Response regulator transcription factor n=1 Tax=Flammeovirga kamogawensis TaxID=373891 RepID=A0ABX8GW13_9BACT|nr:response regulator transcription factor [Flammeovirga kamogawensis]MBB6461683.1 DNA-binding NarL/FixJ family response regulator [Flammeovirga kamogawensis]QWG07392.1 response regulator transcription factor [Flammeovirga kamogawensis]TRX69205.1 response regulator transcription factor [Flammeovirga kamogawensis]